MSKMIDIILFSLGFIGLVVGSITDLQRREVPDYINYGLIVAAVGIRVVHGVLTNDWWQALFALIIGLFCFGVACAFFYSGQWGGGDAKMLIALGVLFATFHSFIPSASYHVPSFLFGWLNDTIMQFILDYNIMFIFYLILNILIAGAVYGVFWSLLLAIMNKRKWMREVMKSHKTAKVRILGILTLLSVCLLIFFSFTLHEKVLKNFMLGLAMLIIIGYYLQLTISAVEKACMIKKMQVSDLTEGEWILHNVYAKGKYICGPKDLGVTNKQIKSLVKHQIKSVMVKIGIPFIPAFLIGFIITVTIGNIFSFVIL